MSNDLKTVKKLAKLWEKSVAVKGLWPDVFKTWQKGLYGQSRMIKGDKTGGQRDHGRPDQIEPYKRPCLLPQ